VTAEATVLIVDDEVRVLDSLEALLAMDYRVLRAERRGARPQPARPCLASTFVLRGARLPWRFTQGK
jgi:response regulator RpfG family c-di-GMP phosphodiesterase